MPQHYAEQKGHRGCAIWLTGLSGAGKSTLAIHTEAKLFEAGIHTFVLDGDVLRRSISRDLGFSEKDRAENVRRAADIARLFVEAGIVVIVALISPFEKNRQLARQQFKGETFFEVFVECPLEICMQRDPHGLYAKAKKGEIAEFTGISSPYEQPQQPDLTVHTAEQNVAASVELISEFILKRIQLSQVKAS